MNKQINVAEQSNVKDLKEALVALCGLGSLVADFIKTKKVDFNQIVGVLPQIQGGIEGMKNVIPELLDLDSDESKEVVDAVSANLKLDSEKTKKIILASLGMIAPGVALFQAFTFEEAPSAKV